MLNTPLKDAEVPLHRCARSFFCTPIVGSVMDGIVLCPGHSVMLIGDMVIGRLLSTAFHLNNAFNGVVLCIKQL